MVIYYNFHPYRKTKINSEIILLKQHISWEMFLELQFSAEESKYFLWMYIALV